MLGRARVAAIPRACFLVGGSSDELWPLPFVLHMMLLLWLLLLWLLRLLLLWPLLGLVDVLLASTRLVENVRCCS